MRLASLLWLAITTLPGAEPPKLPEPFRSIADLASATPPEFNAEALLRIVESGKLPDKNARRALVEEAFQLSASAKFLVRMEGLQGIDTDTRSGSLNQAYAFKLDTLSLQSRAVEDMVRVDPVKAREMFGEMLKPSLPPLTCDDALVYEPSAYYKALTTILNGTFTPKEEAKEVHINLLLDLLAQAVSPSQIAPLANVIQSVGVSEAQQRILWTRFNRILENIDSDDRSHAASLAALSVLDSPSIQASLEKYRQKSHGCESDSAPEPQEVDSAKAASSESSSTEPGSPAPPAPQPSRVAATPKLEFYWQSATAQQLLSAQRGLRIQSSERLFTDADHDSPEWQQRLADYLNLIANWTRDQESSEAVYYHERCLVYTSLLDLVPAGAQADKIIAEYIDFVSNSGLYQQSPVEWFVEPRMLLDRPLNDTLRSKVLEAFQRSGNRVLALAVLQEKTLNHGSQNAAVFR